MVTNLPSIRTFHSDNSTGFIIVSPIFSALRSLPIACLSNSSLPKTFTVRQWSHRVYKFRYFTRRYGTTNRVINQNCVMFHSLDERHCETKSFGIFFSPFTKRHKYTSFLFDLTIILYMKINFPKEIRLFSYPSVKITLLIEFLSFFSHQRDRSRRVISF